MTVILLVLAVGSNGGHTEYLAHPYQTGFIYSGEQSAMLDIANNFAGTLMGIINALGEFDLYVSAISLPGNTMGFVAPMITGLMTKGHDDLKHWRLLFCIASGVYCFGSLVFIVFGTSKEQKWNRRQSSQYQS